ncbi:TSUP family transporter [Puerhibacterium puerhi]|uniref:TSUP family transporter n=1 Tax=Puerhibacterium puerhi TaxID=2692623 RepID=UPI0038B58FD4
MVVAPFVTIAFGPLEGVVLANVWSEVAAALTWWQVRQHVDWRAFAVLTGTSLVGVGLGTVVARSGPEAPLQVVLGVVLGVALAAAVPASIAVARTEIHGAGRGWQAVTGAATGTLVASAGIGGRSAFPLGSPSQPPSGSPLTAGLRSTRSHGGAHRCFRSRTRRRSTPCSPSPAGGRFTVIALALIGSALSVAHGLLHW